MLCKFAFEMFSGCMQSVQPDILGWGSLADQPLGPLLWSAGMKPSSLESLVPYAVWVFCSRSVGQARDSRSSPECLFAGTNQVLVRWQLPCVHNDGAADR